MAFPAGNVKTAEEFEQFIDAQIQSELRRESDYLFTLQLRDFLLKKADLKMPEAFLKRWLYTINEGKFSMEEIEKDFDQFLKMFTWNYLQKHFIKADNLSVSKEEAEAEAKALAAARDAVGSRRDAGRLCREDPRRQGAGTEDLREALRDEGGRGHQVEDQGFGEGRLLGGFCQNGPGTVKIAEKSVSLDFAGVMFAKSFF